MTLSQYAKFHNTPEQLKQLEKYCNAHKKIPEIDISIDEKELDKAIKNAIDTTMKKHFKCS